MVMFNTSKHLTLLSVQMQDVDISTLDVQEVNMQEMDIPTLDEEIRWKFKCKQNITYIHLAHLIPLLPINGDTVTFISLKFDCNIYILLL